MDRDSAGRRRGVRIWVSIAQRDNQRRLYPASATYADQAGADARRLLEHLAARHPDLLRAFRESLHECLGARAESARPPIPGRTRDAPGAGSTCTTAPATARGPARPRPSSPPPAAGRRCTAWSRQTSPLPPRAGHTRPCRETLPSWPRQAQRQRQRPSTPLPAPRRSQHATHGKTCSDQGKG